MSTTPTMEQHALAILDHDLWKLPRTERIQKSGTSSSQSQFSVATPKFLRYLIMESQKLGGFVLDQFWKQIGECDARLKQNVESLRIEGFVSAQRSCEVLFRRLDPKNVDLGRVLAMALEFFTHLGVAFANPGGQKSGTSTIHSISEVIKETVAELLQELHEQGVPTNRKQAVLKALSFNRDGELCPLTHVHFMPFDVAGFRPTLAHIVPHSVGGKGQTLNCVAMFAGPAAVEDIAKNLNGIGNVMNMQQDAHSSYDSLMWGIEAQEGAGKVKYIFRLIPDPKARAPGLIALKDGDEIQFGKGPDGEGLGEGPIPILCNIQLAVARVLRMSGAADIIMKWRDDADDEGCSRLFIASDEYLDMLDAKLFLSGRAVVTF